MPLQTTTSLQKITKLHKPVRVIKGSQGAGKTISILIILINHASSKPDKEILVISAELTKMRLTVIKDFVKVMKMAGLYDERRFIAGTLYRFPNGSFMKFFGLDKEDVGKGLRCDVAYFNEVNKCDAESYRQVASRASVVYADYNPDAEFFIDNDVIPSYDCDFLQLTFEDNELLSAREREQILNYKIKGYNPDGTIKNAYWANIWQVYGLGNTGNLQGCVFENWDIIDEIPKEAEFICHGIDWGFTNDPSAFGSLWKYNNELYANESFYEKGLTNSDIILKLKELNVTPQQMIVADSAEPKSIEDLRRAGFRIEGAKKGADSIRNSISTLQGYKLHITKQSTNLITELRNYRWALDKNGKSLGEPIDNWNHAIDGILRYPALNRLKKQTFFIQ